MSTQGPPITEPESQMKQLRELLFGEHNCHLKQILRQDARQIVTEVFSEALHDRQEQDGSVKTVITPLVEKSVEVSITTHRDQFVGYLYPIVGSVVRKSVTAFLSEFLERTNELIENSLTFKGFSWRMKARRAGIPYAHYVASQTFSFRVEQVMLIHGKTGLLLNTVAYGQQGSADAELISSMLTAINDFVSDSFRPATDKGEQHLDIVKTDDFTLVLKKGPEALLVAAVTGNMPQKVADQLQRSLEEIHSLYIKQLRQFTGDIAAFIHCDQQLNDCLLAELKNPQVKQAKTPWMAWCLVIILFGGLTFYGYKRWELNKLLQHISMLKHQPGIMITDLNSSSLTDIELEILRDPSAINVQRWLTQQAIPVARVHITEKAYLSLEAKMIQTRLSRLIAKYPSLSLTWQQATPQISGQLDNQQMRNLQLDIDRLTGLENRSVLLASVHLVDNEVQDADNAIVVQGLIDWQISRINGTQIGFVNASSELSASAQLQLTQLAMQIQALIKLASEQQLMVSFIIMGASDAQGSQAFNETLSLQRANRVKFQLQQLGIASERLNAIGIGIIDVPSMGIGARKVLFNVLTVKAA